ncbi:MAG: PucR family transcriptional regulator ligand-binding domain-containing protein [Firmicutes bacterium]|nr:PucR family transcriptional regulator ligand-binding domain-containing protein [Bacillota bacterium]
MQNKMGVQLSEVIALDVFKGCEVISGFNGLNRSVTKVNVMEVPDIMPWLQPGEFLMTTAYSIKDNVERLGEMIPKMNSIGVVGMAIKMKRYIEELPASVIELSNKLGFPIISIPQEVSFSDLITAVLTTIVNNQASLLVQIDQFNNRLKEIMLKGGDLQEIATMIHQVVDAPVAITEELFKEYTLVCEPGLEIALTDLIESMRTTKQGKFKRVYQSQGIEAYTDVIFDIEVKRLMIPIYSGDVLYGHVIIWNIDEKVAEKTLFMIEAAASLIALHSAKKLSIYENENKHKIEFIEELLSDQESHRIRAIEKLNYFEFNKTKAYGVVLAKVQDNATEVRMTPNNSQIIKQMNAKLVSVVERMQRYHKGELIYGNKSDRVIFMIGFDPFMNQELVKGEMIQFTKDFVNFAKLEGLESKLLVGMGRVYKEIHSLYKSRLEAERAIQKLSLGNQKERMLHFDDLGIYRILSNETIQPELVQFFMEILGDIVKYDREKDAELLNTLKMYYKCGCNLKKVSEEMFTHYNTVIYRMQRIKEIGNIDLSDQNVSLNVHIALKILDVIKLDAQK